MKENDYYNNIKDLIINNEVTKRVKTYSINKTDLETKYEIDRLLSEAGKHYGKNIIKQYSIRLTNEFGPGYSERNLRSFRQYYIISSKWQTMSAKLTWSHVIELIWLNDKNKIDYYINIVEKNNISVRQLRVKIKSKEYERLPEETKNKLINNKSIDIRESIPEPILIRSRYLTNKEKINEKALHKYILEDLDYFLNQLGEGYLYKQSEYPIKIGSKYNYIDILLFNYIYNCFVVVELK